MGKHVLKGASYVEADMDSDRHGAAVMGQLMVDGGDVGMTSGVYPRKPGLWAGNGGKRRERFARKLDESQAEALREMHRAGARIKIICRTFNIGTELLYHVINRQGAYKE